MIIDVEINVFVRKKSLSIDVVKKACLSNFIVQKPVDPNLCCMFNKSLQVRSYGNLLMLKIFDATIIDH